MESAGLPTADLSQVDLKHFFGCGAVDRPHGVVGLELLGTEALLRSLAVEAGATAAEFFERLGYLRVDRETAPSAIRRTREFGDLCPASAVFMAKQLSATPPP